MRIGQTRTSFRLNIAYLHWRMLIVCIHTLCKVWLDWRTWVNSIYTDLKKNSSLIFLQILTDKCIWQRILKLFLKELITLMIIALLRRTFYVDLSLKSPSPFETLLSQQTKTTWITSSFALFISSPTWQLFLSSKIGMINLSWCILKNHSLIGICIGPKP